MTRAHANSSAIIQRTRAHHHASTHPFIARTTRSITSRLMFNLSAHKQRIHRACRSSPQTDHSMPRASASAVHTGLTHRPSCHKAEPATVVASSAAPPSVSVTRRATGCAAAAVSAASLGRARWAACSAADLITRARMKRRTWTT